MAKKNSPTPLVFLDTNALYAKSNQELLSPKAADTLRRCRQYAKIDVCIPRVALYEVCYQRFQFAASFLRDATGGLRSLSVMINATSPLLPSEGAVRFAIYRQLLRWCGENDVSVTRPLLSSYPWTKIVRASVWRIAPFSKDVVEENEEGPARKVSEKGFRDALQLEDIIQTSGERNRPIVYICNDNMLRTSAEEALQGRITTYRHVHDYENFLHATVHQKNIERVGRMVAVAPSVFFQRHDPTCIVQRFNILQRIQGAFGIILAEKPSFSIIEQSRQFAPLFGIAPTRERWEQAKAITDYIVRIVTTTFVNFDRDNDIAEWQSEIRLAQLYSMPAPLDGLPDEEYICIHAFHVHWKAEVEESGELINPSVDSVEWDDSTVEHALKQNLEFYGLPTKWMRLMSGQRVRVWSPVDMDNILPLKESC